MSIFKIGVRVECPLFGYGTVVENDEIQKERFDNILVNFDDFCEIEEYTADGAKFSHARPTLKVVEDPFEGLPDWVNYIAEDENCERWGFHSEPYTKDIFNSWEVAENDSTCIPVSRINKNWKSSLIKRHQ